MRSWCCVAGAGSRSCVDCCGMGELGTGPNFAGSRAVAATAVVVKIAAE